ncbi:hypothetical protein JCM11641_006747 [Rhodosporidiobolus odoratus]
MDQQSLEALLATLRQTQDGQPPAPPPAPVTSTTVPASSNTPSQQDLDALLSSLQALPDVQHDLSAPTTTSARSRDVSNVAFQEAMPLLNALALDAAFLDKVEGVWDEQKTYELQLKDERNRLERELTSSALPPATRSQKYKDWDRATMKKWAQLQGQQQEKLRALGIPTFQRTSDPTLLKRQERVLNVLVGFLEDRDG